MILFEAFPTFIPGGMIISEAPFGSTKPLVVEEAVLEEEEEDDVLDPLVVELAELEEPEEEEAVLRVDVDGCEAKEVVLVVEEAVACIPAKV